MTTLQDIFREFAGEYAKHYNPTPEHWKVIRAVLRCRTAELGAHAQVCEDCGTVHISYNSCRNRHCNQCQTMAKEKWLAARKEELLETGYFHTVFTIPHELNGIALQNREAVYRLMLRASAETMLELTSDKKYLNGQIGITAILHTWGQNLDFHPHIHQVVPGGAITRSGCWNSSGKKFLLPVKVIGKKFRGKFLHHLKQEYPNLNFYKSLKEYENPVAFNNLIDSMYGKAWVVYSKAPFKNASCVLEYLGRYTHRVAISNNRILSCREGNVTFRWRDYKDSSKQKVMTLSGIEFMRRIMLHVLPKRFVKIRHYGFLSNHNKKVCLRLAQKLTGSKLMPLVRAKLTARDIMLRSTGRDIAKCPECGGHIISMNARASPQNTIFISDSISPSK